MASDRHTEFNKLGDISISIMGSVRVVDWDRNKCLASIELVLLDEVSIYGTAGAATIK